MMAIVEWNQRCNQDHDLSWRPHGRALNRKLRQGIAHGSCEVERGGMFRGRNYGMLKGNAENFFQDGSIVRRFCVPVRQTIIEIEMVLQRCNAHVRKRK